MNDSSRMHVTRRWLLAHWIINGLIGFHLILAGGYMGWKSHKLTHLSMTAHGVCMFQKCVDSLLTIDNVLPSRLAHHSAEQKRGLFIIGLTIGQLVLGLIIHYTRIKIRFFGHRPPQNFVHALQGLIVLGLANYQVCLYCHKSFRLLIRVGKPGSRRHIYQSAVVLGC